MVKKKGGKQWKEGADTCVLDPIVTCTNSADDEIPPEERKKYVSRIVETGSSDIATGDGIRQYYPGLVSERMVSIHRIACSPLYIPEDEVIGEKISDKLACNDLRNLDKKTNKLGDNSLYHVNLITAKFEGPYSTEADRIKKTEQSERTKFDELLKNLRGAMHAAVSLVDDVGPWYIHTDCHYGNILFNRGETGIETALADFGRMIIVQNPTDNDEIQVAVNSWGNQFGLNDQKNYLDFVKYPQHPREVLSELQLFNNNIVEEDLAHRKNTLRGWTPYVILRQTYLYAKEYDPLYYPDLEPILRANNQAELIEAINEFVMKIVGRPRYIEEALLIPSARRGKPFLAQRIQARRAALESEKQRLLAKAALPQRYAELQEAAKPRPITGQTGIVARMFGLGKRRKTRRQSRKINVSSSRRLPSSPRRTARRSFS